MTEFVSSRLCLIVFKTFCDRSRIGTHAHTRVPEFSTQEFLESGALDPRPSCRVYVDIFLCDMCFFKWVEFAFQRFFLLSGFCHPFQKICVSTHAYIRVSNVSAGYPPFWALWNCSGINHRRRCDFLFSFAFHCYLELTLQYERICQLKAVPHRVQNVFWQEWDSNPRTHSCTRILDSGISWVWHLRPSAILPGLRRHFSLWYVLFQMGWICISENYSAKRFFSSISKDLRFNPRVHSCFTCLGWLSSVLCT